MASSKAVKHGESQDCPYCGARPYISTDCDVVICCLSEDCSLAGYDFYFENWQELPAHGSFSEKNLRDLRKVFLVSSCNKYYLPEE